MPGSSLWLAPPPASPLARLLAHLIEDAVPGTLAENAPPTTPSTAAGSASSAAPMSFAPHVTLTSEIEPGAYAGVGAQAWLDGLPVPSARVRVRFRGLGAEGYVFRRFYLRAEKDGTGLGELAAACRAYGVAGGGEEVLKWVEEYQPHCSLLYVNEKVSAEQLAELEMVVRRAGVGLDGEGNMGGWECGQIWLVPTEREVGEWKPIAVKDLK